MKYKTHYKNSFTLIELIIVITILSLVTVTVALNTNPISTKKKARDNTRLSNIASIERAINEYFIDNMKYPGDPNVLYTSSSINWIGGLSSYITTLPQDPLNEGNYYYFYINDGYTYELNTYLEYFDDLMKKDNGNNDLIYEVGNNLLLLADPTQ